MKNKIISILILLFLCKNINAQISQFVKLPHDTSSLFVLNCIELGGFYYFTSTQENKSINIPNSIAKIFKTNNSGVILDSIIIPTGNFDTLFTVYQLDSLENNKLGLYSIKSNYNTSGIHNIKFSTFYLDTNLNIIYSYDENYNSPLNILNIGGNYKINNKIYHNFYFLQSTYKSELQILDKLGQFTLSKQLPTNSNNYISDIILHPDGKNLILSTISDFIYTDSNLNEYKNDIIQISNFPSSSNVGLMNYNNSSFLTVGCSYTTNSNIADSFCVCRIDTNNNLLKKSCFSAPQNSNPTINSNIGFKCYDKFSNNNIYFGGRNNYDVTLSSPTLFSIANVDNNLNIKWIKYLGGDYSYQIFSFKATSDGGCLIMGKYNIDKNTFIENNNIEPLILKIDSTGTITSLINFSNNLTHQVLAYPNPSTTTISFIVSNQLDNATATIFSSNGQYVKSFIVHHGENVQNISTLPLGNYFYEIVNKKGEKANGKFSKK